MTTDLSPIDLTDEQKGAIYGILSVGCDRQTAADYIGCSLADLRRAMQGDSKFAAEVCRTEATVELTHMGNVRDVAKEKKDWRASVWWLERRSPERFGRRAAGAITAPQLKAFLSILVDVVRENTNSEDDRARIIARVESLAADVDMMLRDARMSLGEILGGDDPSSIDLPTDESDDAGAGPDVDLELT